MTTDKANGHYDGEDFATELPTLTELLPSAPSERVRELEARIAAQDALLARALSALDGLLHERNYIAGKFAGAMEQLEALAGREGKPDQVAKPAAGRPGLSDDEWRACCQSFVLDDVWDEKVLGGEPGSADCRCPPTILREYFELGGDAATPPDAVAAEAPVEPVEEATSDG